MVRPTSVKISLSQVYWLQPYPWISESQLWKIMASDGNSSVAELEVRVEALEGTAVDHEIRISNAEADINGNHENNIYSSLCEDI